MPFAVLGSGEGHEDRKVCRLLPPGPPGGRGEERKMCRLLTPGNAEATRRRMCFVCCPPQEPGTTNYTPSFPRGNIAAHYDCPL